MQNDFQTHCQLCFGAFDPNDRKTDYRTGVQCAGCFTQYHELCWIQNGRKCPKCNSTAVHSVELANLVMYQSTRQMVAINVPADPNENLPFSTNPPLAQFQPTPMSQPKQGEVVSELWRVAAFVLGTLLIISLLCNAVLILTR